MSHKKWRETKQKPSRAELTQLLLSFPHFLCSILSGLLPVEGHVLLVLGRHPHDHRGERQGHYYLGEEETRLLNMSMRLRSEAEKGM